MSETRKSFFTDVTELGMADLYDPPGYDNSRIGASSSGKCVRQVIKTFTEPPIEPDTRLKKIFGKGTVMHKFLHKALVKGAEQQDGDIVSINPWHMHCFQDLWCYGLRIGGTPDEIVFYNGKIYVIDWKTSNERAFHFKQRSQEASRQNRLQVATYVLALKDYIVGILNIKDCPVIEGMVCYVNKSDDELLFRDIFIEKDMADAKDYWKKVSNAYRRYDESNYTEFPSSTPEEGWECLYCPHYKNITECRAAFAEEQIEDAIIEEEELNDSE